jgi:predicted DNA-binding protein
MGTTTIRVSLETRELINQLSQSAGLSMQEVVAEALDIYRRQQVLREANAGYARVREQKALLEELHAEEKEWDQTLADGLAEYEW